MFCYALWFLLLLHYCYCYKIYFFYCYKFLLHKIIVTVTGPLLSKTTVSFFLYGAFLSLSLFGWRLLTPAPFKIAPFFTGAQEIGAFWPPDPFFIHASAERWKFTFLTRVFPPYAKVLDEARFLASYSNVIFIFVVWKCSLKNPISWKCAVLSAGYAEGRDIKSGGGWSWYGVPLKSSNSPAR